jgi:hypothetical protein
MLENIFEVERKLDESIKGLLPRLEFYQQIDIASRFLFTAEKSPKSSSLLPPSSLSRVRFSCNVAKHPSLFLLHLSSRFLQSAISSQLNHGATLTMTE